MKLNLKDITRYEFIGIKAEVVDSRNKTDIGIKGQIVDETKNTIVIQTKQGKKRLIKKNIIIEVIFNKKRIRIDGKLLAGRPEERIKK